MFDCREWQLWCAWHDYLLTMDFRTRAADFAMVS